MSDNRTFHVLNLGAGVQSTALYLMFMEGRVKYGEETIRLDHAVFADTQDEPQVVYEHLEWIKMLQGPPILTPTKGRLSEHLSRGVNSTGQRFAPIPAFTKGEGDEEEGRVRRQCSKEGHYILDSRK